MNASQLIKLKSPLILASKSPRRKQLLHSMGFDFEVVPSNINEDKIFNEKASNYVMTLAKAKAAEVASEHPNSIIIGADTTVVFDNSYLNKPKDPNEARQMLNRLSGNTHSVFSGLCIFDTSQMLIQCDYSRTDVTFRKLDDEEINYYVDSGSPMDKAGSYGIQDDMGSIFVESIVGDFYNVVGLPIVKLYKLLRGLSD
ncbi:Maf family protein [Candidatus Kapabacteria bacterium]|nr:Maf family protein [Candidatus Kapabacteria bacterium]